GPEGMDVALARCLPALERDAQLDRALRGGEVFLLAYPEQAVEGAQRRDRGLAHADRADLLRLDQGDVQHLAERARQRGGGHPAGGSAPGDHHATDGSVGQRRIAHRDPRPASRCSSFARTRPARASSKGPSAPRAGGGTCPATVSSTYSNT